MVKRILLALVLLVAVLAAVIAMRPDEVVIERTATIAASPVRVFEEVNELRRWEKWSPWARLDPAMKRQYEGPPAGVGASYAWAGNDEVGEGRMTILESEPGKLMRAKLEFFQPFEATNSTEFVFAPEGAGTRITWRMTCRNNFIAKAVGLFMDVDAMVGGQFEQGLANLKQVIEAPPADVKRP